MAGNDVSTLLQLLPGFVQDWLQSKDALAASAVISATVPGSTLIQKSLSEDRTWTRK